jgi:hypothetical protein
MVEINEYLGQIEQAVVNIGGGFYEGITRESTVMDAVESGLPLGVVTLRVMGLMRERAWNADSIHYQNNNNSNCGALADSVFNVFKQLALFGELKEVRFTNEYLSEYHGKVLSGVEGSLGEYVIVSGDWAEVFGGNKDIRGEPNKRVISRGINNPFGGIYAGNDGRNAHRILSVLTKELENRLLD